MLRDKKSPFNIHPESKVVNHPTEGLVVLPPPSASCHGFIEGDVILFGSRPRWFLRPWCWLMRVVGRRSRWDQEERQIAKVGGSTITIQ